MSKIFKLGKKMCIKKTIIVNIVCNVLVIIRFQITTDARIKTLEGLIWCHLVLVKLQCFYIQAPQPSPPPFFFYSGPLHRRFI